MALTEVTGDTEEKRLCVPCDLCERFCLTLRSVAVAVTLVAEAPADADELPVVAVRVEDQAQHAVHRVLAHLAVRRQGVADGVEGRAARPHHELPHAAPGVRARVRVLRREALV